MILMIEDDCYCTIGVKLLCNSFVKTKIITPNCITILIYYTMKHAEFTIENNTIEFWNTILGVEKVLLNGKKVSSKFSFSGENHPIKLQGRNLVLKVRYVPGNMKMQLMENDLLLEEQSAKISIKQRILWSVIGVGIGFLLARLANYL
jgi:hypothetical protein